METTIQKKNDPILNQVLFAGRRAIEIYKWIRFRACDNGIYQVWNVYDIRGSVRIAVDASSWWNAENVLEWLPGLGEGMKVITPLGVGYIQNIAPNRTCEVHFADRMAKSFPEAELLWLNAPHT